MIIEKNINGYWVIYETIRGYLMTKVYIGYTKMEAIKMFKQATR
jgi:hypothetical protein